MKRLIIASITATIVIVVMAGALMPILDDATAINDTFTNEGVYFVEVNPTDTYTIEYDKANNSGIIVINNTNMNVPFSEGYTILAIDDAILRLQSGDNTIQYKGDGQYITGITKLNITVSSGSITGTYTGSGGVETSWPNTSYTKAFVISPDNQDNIMKAYTSTAYMNGDSEFIGFGQSILNGTILVLCSISGTIEDGATVTVLDSHGGELADATVSNIVVHYAEVDGYIDLYTMTEITFDVTYQGTVNSRSYSAIVVPSEVTAEKSVHFTDSENAILGAVPIFLIVALLVAIVAMVIRSRMD